MFAIKLKHPSIILAGIAFLVAAAIATPAPSYADDVPDEAADSADAAADYPMAPEIAEEPKGADGAYESGDLLDDSSAIYGESGPVSEQPLDAPPDSDLPDSPQTNVGDGATLVPPSDGALGADTESEADAAPEADAGSEAATEPEPEPFSPAAEIQTGWVERDGAWFFLDESGTPLLGEQCIGGQWYYLDPAQGGARATGFARVPVESGSGSFKTAYYDADGTRVTGVQTIDGQGYFFSDSGALTTGFVRYDDESTHFFDPESGQLQTDVELYVHDAWRLFDETDGSMVTGEQFVDGEWRYYDDFDGSRLTHDQLVERVVSAAQGEVGTPDEIAAGYQDYITALGGSYCPYGPCMSFVLRCFQLAGMLSFPANGFVSCWPHDILDWQFAHGLVSSVPQIGSIAYFCMPDSFAAELGLSANHAELVVDLGPNYVVTIGVLGGVRYNVWYPGLAPSYYGACIP